MPNLQLSSSARQALIVAVLVILSSFGVGVARLAWTDYNLRALAAQEQAKVDTLKREIGQTEQSIAQAKTDDYVRQWAREIAKQTLAGEIPVVVVAQGQPSSTTAVAAPRPQSPVPPASDAGVPRWQALLDEWFAPR